MPLQMHLQLALDTNVLFDRAENRDFAVAIFDFLSGHEIALIVTRTVLAELDSAITRPLSRQEAQLAERALGNLLSWGIKPVVISDSSLSVAAEVSKALRLAQLLPYEESHDGSILAETAMANAKYLVTSDVHLISMDRQKTKQILQARSLPEVHVASPRNLYYRLKREKPIGGLGA
jgi:predicted nucleic acid-binding protein